MALLELNEDQIQRITDAFKLRYAGLKKGKTELDEKVKKWTKIYHSDYSDKTLQYKHHIPYVYTIIQSMLAFLMGSFFSTDKTLSVDIEVGKRIHNAKGIENYCNSIMEMVKLKKYSYDIFLNALIEPIGWVQLIPNGKKGDKFNVAIDTLNFYDVLFDLGAKNFNDSDYMVRMIKGFKDLYYDMNHYYRDQLELVRNTTPPDEFISKDEQKYETQTGTTYYSPDIVNNNDKVQVWTWYADFNIDGEDELSPYIFSFGNDEVLIRAEENKASTDKKIYLFPVSSIRNVNSLLGKSFIEPIENLNDLLNESVDLRQDHFQLLVKLLFKYDKNADIDLKDIHASGGNAMAHDGDSNAIQTFDIKNMLKDCSLMIQEDIQFIQQTTGVTDQMMGTVVGRGITETARGATIIQQNSLQKFNLIVSNVMPGMMDIVKFLIILFNKFAPDSKRVKDFGVKQFVKAPEEDIEHDYKIDFYFKNMAQDLDRRRAQFINAINVFGQFILQAGGNVKDLVRLALEQFDLKKREIQEIMGETPEGKRKAKEQKSIAEFFGNLLGGGKKGAGPMNPQARLTEGAGEENQTSEGQEGQ